MSSKISSEAGDPQLKLYLTCFIYNPLKINARLKTFLIFTRLKCVFEKNFCCIASFLVVRQQKYFHIHSFNFLLSVLLNYRTTFY